MVVDQKWLDAWAVPCIAHAFKPEQRANGWPQVMEPFQLAALQRPYPLKDAERRNYARALCNGVLAACKDGSLPCEERVERQQIKAARVVQPMRSRFAREGGDDGFHKENHVRDGRQLAYEEPAEYANVTHYFVDAGAFSEWLAGQGLEPSEHIAAWCKACAAEQVASAPAVAVTENDVQDWEALLPHHKSLFPEGLSTWPEDICIIAYQFHAPDGRVSRRGPGTKKQMAKALGVAEGTVALMLARGRDAMRGRQRVDVGFTSTRAA